MECGYCAYVTVCVAVGIRLTTKREREREGMEKKKSDTYLSSLGA